MPMKNRYTKSIKRCLLVMASLFAIQMANAQEVEQYGVVYYYLDNSTMEASVTTHFSSDNGEEDNLSGLVTVEIPATIISNRRRFTVTSIEEYGFYKCVNLTSVTLPSTITSIGDYAFGECNNLTKITCSAKEPPVCETNTFSNYSAELYVLGECIDLYKSADIWENFRNFQPIGVNESAVKIGDVYYNIDDSTLEASVTSNIIFDSPYNYHGLTVANIPQTISYDGRDYTVTSIEDYAFNNCSSLTSIELPNTVTTIGSHAFFRCSGLISIEIPNSVTYIGGNAFQYCTSLTTVKLPDSLTYLDAYAFSDDSSLNSINIPNSITTLNRGTFWRCSNLTSIDIPDSVTSIDEIVFSGCSALSSINLPNSIISIGGYAFASCANLSRVEIPNSITTIEEGTFSNCTGLTSIELPNTITSIGVIAFNKCNSLTKIEIPNSVISIGEYAFIGCSNLEKITCYAIEPPLCEENTFPEYTADLYVPTESIDLYKSADVWQLFSTILPIGEVSGIEAINCENASSYNVYDLKGRLILSTSNKDDINNLEKGIYIINGEKYVIR